IKRFRPRGLRTVLMKPRCQEKFTFFHIQTSISPVISTNLRYSVRLSYSSSSSLSYLWEFEFTRWSSYLSLRMVFLLPPIPILLDGGEEMQASSDRVQLRPHDRRLSSKSGAFWRPQGYEGANLNHFNIFRLKVITYLIFGGFYLWKFKSQYQAMGFPVNFAANAVPYHGRPGFTSEASSTPRPKRSWWPFSLTRRVLDPVKFEIIINFEFKFNFKINVNYEIIVNFEIKHNFDIKVNFVIKLNFEIIVNFEIKHNFEIKVNFEIKINFEIELNFEIKLNFEIIVNFEIKHNFEIKVNFEIKLNFEIIVNFVIKLNFEIIDNFEIKHNFEIKVNFVIKLNFEIIVNFEIKHNFEIIVNFEIKHNFEIKLNFEINVNFEIKINFVIIHNFEIKVNEIYFNIIQFGNS
ncbi:unnamed protein product, partial [Nesidiocoris tenuis]